MKKILLVLCACALLLSAAACGSDDKADHEKDGTKAGTKQTQKADADTGTTEDDTVSVKDDITPEDDVVVSDDTSVSGTIIEPSGTGYEPIDPDETFDSDEPADPSDTNTSPIYVEDDTIIQETISEGGTESGLWPTESVPEEIPEYTDYTEMYAITHDETDTSENWYFSFDTTEEGYIEWLDKLSAAGYTESNKIVGFWGNGDHIINLFTEEIDGVFCVSVDVFRSKPVVMPAGTEVFPAFSTTDSTLYGWYTKENTVNISYACGMNFDVDLEAYKLTLAANGFTVSDNEATLTKDGKTYMVKYNISNYEDIIEYTY